MNARSANLTIRAPTPGDAPSLARLLGVLGYPTTPDRVPPRLTRLAADPAAILLLAADDDAILGFATGHARASIHVDGEVAWRTSLVVDTPARRRGVGGALVAAIVSWARARGCARLSVTTAVHRDDAHAFYETLGFALTGRRYSLTLPATQSEGAP